jgi:glycosyltransferase involved in cell wall biosynthesis
MREADVLIVPSGEGEGFGLPVIEAMACGVPVVMTNIKSFKEITRDIYPIGLSDVGDIQNMVRNVAMIFEDNNLFYDAIKKGIYISSFYNYKKVGDNLLSFFKKFFLE